MPDVTVNNAPLVMVQTAIVSGRLVLTVNGVTLGTVTDEFTVPPTPPPTMQLFIADLPDGSPVAAQWQVSTGGPWFPFTRGSGGVYANYPVPAVGGLAAYVFVAIAVDHGIYVTDPKLVLKTKT